MKLMGTFIAGEEVEKGVAGIRRFSC